MGNRQRESYWRLLLRAATRPLHLALLILSLLMAAELPLLTFAGILLYLLLVWRDSNNPELVERALSEGNDEDVRAWRIASAYQEQMARAGAARRRIHEAITGADRPLARVTAPIGTQADQVIERLKGLVERAQSIEEFLARENREELEGNLAALDEQIAASADEFARGQYAQARSAREEQLRVLDELSICLGRVRAQITNVLASLEAAEARVVRLQTTDLRQADTVSDAVTHSLQSLSQEIAGFQESVDATMALRNR